jgi:uncharacterized membrane protein
MFSIKQEPVAFSIAKGNKDEAAALLKRVYKKGKLSEEEFEQRIILLTESLGKTTSMESTKTTFA